MRDCVLRAYGHGFEQVLEVPVEVPVDDGVPRLTMLDGIVRTRLTDLYFSHACLEEEEGRVLALYVPEKMIPRKAVRLASRRAPGRWFTGTVTLGDEGGHRALVGPEVFLRQFDVGGADAWLAVLFVRFGHALPVARLGPPDRELQSWALGGQRYLYAHTGWKWRLWGAGNTPAEQIDTIIASGLDVQELTWSIGAVPLTHL